MKQSKKNRPKFSEIISWFIGLAGVVTAAISSFLMNIPGFATIYIVVLAAETLVALIWGKQVVDSLREGDKVKQKEREIENLTGKISLQEAESKKAVNDVLNNMHAISGKIKEASKLNNEFCIRIPAIAEKSYRVIDTLQSSGITDQEKLERGMKDALSDFSLGLFDVYNRYTSNLLNHIIAIEKSLLSAHRKERNVSVTIKLFDRPYFSSKDKLSDIKVYTSFRDRETYNKHEREIGEILYTIDGNTDFSHCLKKDHFIINNARDGSESYSNEHAGFDTYYNCAVVVSIRTKLNDGTFKFFGYLCCDCLNMDQEEVFEASNAQFLFALSQQYATFLDTLDANWAERVGEIADLPHDILGLIYQKTYKDPQKH